MGALTQDEKDAIRDKAVAQWWKNWFAADYSWDGLTKFPWKGWKVVESKTAYQKYLKTHGLPAGCPNEACQVVPADFDGLPEGTKTRDATLQDYWRDQEDELEISLGEVEQKPYTKAHLPIKYENGTESWKANPNHKEWDKLRQIVTKRINCGVRTEIEFNILDTEIVTGSDGRSNFQGCVLPALPPKTETSDPSDDTEIALHITLQRAVVLQPQNFAHFIFGSATNFHHAQFSGGHANFYNAQFSGGDANFLNAQFSGGDADFYNAQFSDGDADFNNAQFSGGDANDALFGNAKFKIGFDFENAKFEKRANFKNSVFPPAAGSKNAFRGAEFFGQADFSRNKFKDKKGKALPPDDLHFPFTAFANANFKDRILLTQRGEKYAQGEFDRAMRSLKDACKGEDEDTREDRWVALESGCTTLKQAMESISDKNRAQRYFKFELLARQQRPMTSRVTKFITRLYGWAADYGGSIGRPLYVLTGVWLVFALIYGVVAYFAGVKPASWMGYIWGPCEFSLSHTFRPLFIWSTSIPSADVSWVGKLRAQLYGGEWFLIKLVATLQSFLSITLLFLFGLATKRKFQMG